MGIGKYEKDYIPIIKNEYIKSNLYLEMNKLESKRHIVSVGECASDLAETDQT
jgi:hypothetical protein